MIRVSQVKVPLDYARRPLADWAAMALRTPVQNVRAVFLRKKSADARKKSDIRFVLTLDVELAREPAELPPGAERVKPDAPRTLPPPVVGRERPVVVGMGPAGLFAALHLARQGANPLVIERGRASEARQRDVAAFWRGGALQAESNVLFGEGGAGAFSDGKLNSGISDPRCREVLRTFVEFGAPEEILWEARPHVGTDHLAKVVVGIRQEILRLGGEVRFETRLTAVRAEGGRLSAVEIQGPAGETSQISASQVILAIGHSARDTFQMLRDAGAAMEKKPFSIGARIEHRQETINRAQWGDMAGHPALGAADYRLSQHLPDGRTAYTFCMCPGGTVVAAASEVGGVAVNGMSEFARAGENANSALLISVGPEDFPGDDPLSGVEFQRRWERLAFQAGGGGYRAPAQLAGDFLKNRASRQLGGVSPTYRPGVTLGNLADCLPEFAVRDMRSAILLFDRKLRGFAAPDAVLTGVETRSSSPVRILRGRDCESLAIAGLYPAGEGAGYAGGILSAAVDGMRCAEAALRQIGSE